MSPRPLGTIAPPPPRRDAAGWLLALVFAVKTIALLAPIAVAFVILTALASGVVEDETWRYLGGALACLGLPLFVRWRLAEFLTRRRFRAPSVTLFVAISNLALAAGLAFGFADDVGRALRRHGDWFVGERNGAVARGYRAGVERIAAYLEKFDPQPELAPVILPPDLADVPAGPWRPGEKPPEGAPITVAWFHPLAGPRRALPGNESRRFGAVRPQPRPPECELGHCGVDVGGTVGEPVFATFDGVVEKIERDEVAGGRAGRYVRLGHKEGTVTTRYIHLDSIRGDLKEGDHVKGGEVIARLGQSGIFHSAPHLHFGISLRPGGRGGSERYIDPEPLLRSWQLPDPSSALRQTATASR